MNLSGGRRKDGKDRMESRVEGTKEKVGNERRVKGFAWYPKQVFYEICAVTRPPPSGL